MWRPARTFKVWLPKGATVSESIAIAKDIAEIILADQFEKKQLLPEVPEKMRYSLILDY